MRGLWRGNTVNMLRMIPNKGVLHATNDLYKDLTRNLAIAVRLAPLLEVHLHSLHSLRISRGREGGGWGEPQRQRRPRTEVPAALSLLLARLSQKLPTGKALLLQAKALKPATHTRTSHRYPPSRRAASVRSSS